MKPETVQKTHPCKADNLLVRFFKDENGVTAIEYAMIASATGFALAASMPVLKPLLEAKFAGLAAALK